MDWACPCLNVQVRLPPVTALARAAQASAVLAATAELRQATTNTGNHQHTGNHQDPSAQRTSGPLPGLQADPFFAPALNTDSFSLANRLFIQWPRSAGSWAEGRKFPSLVSLRGLSSSGDGEVDWEVVRCLLCECDIWAKPLGRADRHILLINADIPKGEEVVSLGIGAEFSAALGLRLLPQHLAPSRGGGDSLGSGDDWWLGTGAGGGPAAAVQASVAEYLRNEQESMENRVRAYVEAEHNRFELLRKEAKRHRDAVLRDLQARDLVKEPANLLDPGARARNGSGGNDSAVPLSPVSLTSLGDQSTRPLGILNSNRSKGALNSSPVIGSEDSGLGHDHKEEEEDPLFRLDEDNIGALSPPPPPVPLVGGPACLADDEAADGDTDDSGTAEDMRRLADANTGRGLLGARPIATAAAPGAGCLVPPCGKSLPVRVPCRFWPPKDAVGSEQASSSEDEDDYNTGDRIAVKPRRGTEYSGKDGRDGRRREADVAESMRKLARSIQAADDPERIFGERPARRRYKTGTAQAMEAVVRMRHSARPLQPQQESFLPPL